MIPARFLLREGNESDLRLAPFLFRVDPIADALVTRLDELPKGQGFAAVDEALKTGKVPAGAPTELTAFLAATEYVPAWVDWKTIDRAGELLYRTGIFGGLVLGYKSLIYGYAAPGGNKPLVFSGRLREHAPRRLAETSRFVEAVAAKGGLLRGAPGYVIAAKVRLMHAHVRSLIWRSGRWNRDLWGDPINQHDMAATLLLFSYVFILGVREIGFNVPKEEAEDYIHLFRYVGHLLGVDPELAPASFADAHRLAHHIEATQGRADDDARMLTRAILDIGAVAARTDEERRVAERRKPMILALSRHMLGPSLADDLGIPSSRWDRLVPVVIRSVRGAEELRRRSPRARAFFLAQGERYWRAVVERGSDVANYEFALPHALLVDPGPLRGDKERLPS